METNIKPKTVNSKHFNTLVFYHQGKINSQWI
jgi:hypothetical protein